MNAQKYTFELSASQQNDVSSWKPVVQKNNPRILLYGFTVFVFTIPWDNALVIPGFGTVTKLLGIINVFFLLAYLFGNKVRLKSNFPWFFLWPFFFLLWSITGAFWSLDLDSTITITFTLFQSLIVFWITWQYCVIYDDGRQLVSIAFLLGCCVAIAIVLNFSIYKIDLAINSRDTGAIHPNGLAILLGLSIPIWWQLRYLISDKWIKALIFYSYYPVALTGILITGSRTGLIIFLISSGVYLIGQKKVARQLMVFGMPLLIVLIHGYFQFADYFPNLAYRIDRLANYSTEHYQYSRGQFAEDGINLLKNNIEYVIAGVGNGAFIEIYESTYYDVKVAHNVFVSLLVQTGVIGLFFYLMTFISIISRLLFLQDRELRFSNLILIFSLLVAMSSSNMEYEKSAWFILGMIASSRVIKHNRSSGYHRDKL